MTTLEKLHAIEEKACIYNIHYCRAGVGITFFEPERCQGPLPEAGFISPNIKDRSDYPLIGEGDGWRRGLVTHTYYPTFEACIDAEYERLTK